MVRDDETVGAKSRRLAGVLGIEDALDDQQTIPFGPDRLDIAPRDRRIEIPPHPGKKVLKSRSAFQDRRDAAKRVRAAAHADIPCPAGPRQRLSEPPRGAERPRGAGQSRMIVAVAAARYRHIDGEHERRAARAARGCKQVLHEGPVADHVELEPKWRCGCRGDFADRTGADGRQGEGNARSLGCAHRLALAAPRIHSGKTDRREDDRQRLAPPEELGGEVDRGDVAQDALAKRHLGKIDDVAAQRRLGVRAAVDIVEEEAWQAPPRGCTIVGNAGDRHARTLSAALWVAARSISARHADR